MTKILMGLLLLTLISISAFAQKPCVTDNVYWSQRAANPLIKEIDEQLEQEIARKLSSINLKQFANKATLDTTYYDVPVVIHIIHNYGADFVDDNNIYAAFKDWADVYLCQNADTYAVIPPFKPYIGNARIKLHLATKDPNGNPTKGITKHWSYLANNGDDEAKLDGWPNNKYINIWFVGQFSASHSGAAAYSYYPSVASGMPYYDGVISLASYINTEKTIPHEIGHSFNLQHVWGNNNSPGTVCGDDQVADTPPTKGHNPSGCTAANLYDVTCSIGYTANGINYPDTNNSQNIMDYTYCEKMFTIGQVARMRAALTSNTAGRNNLYSAANLAATGALNPMPDLKPVAEFSVERALIANDRTYFLCANNPTEFVFQNRSWNDTITNANWTFSNSALVPTSTSTDFVNNQFKQPGWVTVTLSAIGNNSGTSTITNTHAVYVADSNMLQPGGYTQNFSTSNDHENWPSINYFNNNFQWEWYQGAGYGDNACMRYRAFDTRTSPANKTGTPNGDWDDLFTPGFDPSGYQNKNLNLNFYTAGSSKGSVNDSMQVLISIDCGRYWKRIASLTGQALANNGSSNNEFKPTAANQWTPQTIAIPSAYLPSSKLFFKFRYFPSDQGNDLYFDKFSLSQFPTEVNEVATDKSFLKIFPNPSSGKVNVVYKTGNDGNVLIQIKDITGNIIFNTAENLAPNTVFTKELDNIFPANGMYFISVSNENNIVTEKLMMMR